MHAHRPRLGNQKGLTLLETMVTVFVSGVLLAAAMPSVSTIVGAHQIKASMRTTTNYVRVVRATAVARNRQSRLVIANGGTKLSTEIWNGASWVSAGSPVVLEGGMTVSAVSPVTGLVFTPQGTTTAPTTLTLQSPRGATRSVTVSLLGSAKSS